MFPNDENAAVVVVVFVYSNLVVLLSATDKNMHIYLTTFSSCSSCI